MNFQHIEQMGIQAFKESFLKMLAVCLAIGALTVLVVLLKEPSFRSSWILLLPGTERSSTVNLDNIGEARTTTRNAYGNVSLSPKHTYKEIALSSAVMNNAAEKFGVPAHSFSRPQIKLIQQTPAIKFTLKGAHPEKLIQRAKIFNESFHQVLDGLRENEIERQNLGVRQKLNQSQTNLDQAQNKIVAFKNASNLLDQTQLEQRTSHLETLRMEMVRTRIDLDKHQSRSKELNRLLGLTAQEAMTLSRLATKPEVMALLPAIQELLAEVTLFRATTGKQYPPRKIAENQLKAMMHEMQTIIKKQPWLKGSAPNSVIEFLNQQHQAQLIELVELTVDVNGLESQLKQLALEVKTLDNDLREYATEIAMLESLEREFQIAEAIFSSALTRLDSSKFDIYATYPLTQLLTLPGMNVVRDHFATKLFILVAFLVSGLICFGLFLYRMRELLLLEQGQSKLSLGGYV